MTRLENSEEQAFMDWCHKKLIPCYKLECRGRKGWPDRSVFLPDALTIYFEFKQPNGVLSEHQKKIHKMLRELGNQVDVVITSCEAKAIVEERL